MAEAIGLAASLISLASLFSTCIDCFECYRTAKDCPRQIKTKLVKLDFEKTRLLIWANEVGLTSTDASSRNSGIEHHEDALRATLEQIYDLLTEAKEMQERYGVRQRDELTVPVDSSVELLSRNSLEYFKTSYRRFRGKFLNVDTGPKLQTRIRWAIVDESKFEVLVKTLRNFVDNLFWLLSVDRAAQDRVVEQDIMAITDLEDLEIIQDASEHEYQAWSDIASRAVDRTERATDTGTASFNNGAVNARLRDLRIGHEPIGGHVVGEIFSPSETVIVLSYKILT